MSAYKHPADMTLQEMVARLLELRPAPRPGMSRGSKQMRPNQTAQVTERRYLS